ncbi:class I SAM-dependent methyltransferase [Candidatus Saccharibacteria bacterium]|nr:MAG: class I SAM-dependent methyltransferase [Candidatus Saccharibacteria bacterium]
MNLSKKYIPIYKRAPVTASTAEFLATVYGASSIDGYAMSLPCSAEILDVGAGNSELGQVITKLRPDIVWTNLDVSYTVDELTHLRRKAPSNLKYKSGDVLNINDLPKPQYDIIYAFWILPHIGLEDPALIKVGIINMLKLLKSGRSSKLIIGPLMNKRSSVCSTRYLTTELRKNVSRRKLNEAIKDSSVPRDKVAYLRAMNRAGLTTLRNEQRTGQKPTKLGLWDYKHREYVKAFTLRGLLLMTRFRMYLAIEKAKTVKD